MVRLYTFFCFLLLVLSPVATLAQTQPPTGSLKKDINPNQLCASEQLPPETKPSRKRVLDCKSYPIKNQILHQTCVGHACAAAFSIGRNNKYPKLERIEFSAAWIYQHIKQSESSKCDIGTYAEDALEWMETEGVCSTKDFPEECDGIFTAHLEAIASKNKINYLGRLDPTEKETWKNIIRTSLSSDSMPVVIEIDLSSSFETCKTDEWSPRKNENPGPSSLSHALLIVGYDDDRKIGKQKGAFLLMNSWGTGWGNSGFVWVSYKHLVEWGHSAYLLDVPPSPPEGTPTLGTIHLTVVADTKHSSLGEGAQRDAYNMQSTWQEIAVANSFRLKKHLFIGKNVMRKNIKECLDTMSIDSNDVFVFCFSGYGVYEKSSHIQMNMRNGEKYEVAEITNMFEKRKRQNHGKKKEPLYLFFIDISDKKLNAWEIRRPFQGFLFKKKKYKALLQESLSKKQNNIQQDRDTSMQFFGLFTDWKGTVVAVNRMPSEGRKGKEYLRAGTVFTTPYGSHFTNSLVSSFRYFAHREADWHSILLYAASKARQFSYVARRFRDDELTADFELKLIGHELKRMGLRYPPLPTESPIHTEPCLEETEKKLFELLLESVNVIWRNDVKFSVVALIESRWAKDIEIITHSDDGTQVTEGSLAAFLRQRKNQPSPVQILEIKKNANGEPSAIHIRY